MRFLGKGRCSAVFSLSDDDDDDKEKRCESGRSVTSVVRQQCERVYEIPHRLWGNIALRVSKAVTAVCPTCSEALADFIGFKCEIPLTNELRMGCANINPSLLEHCRSAGHAHLIPNFVVHPGPLVGDKRESRCVVVEIKPKGVWRPPRVVGIIVDNTEYYIHPVKLHQCRFSLMQFLKRERQAKGGILPPGRRAEGGGQGPASGHYCPNMILLGDQPSIATGLRHLVCHPGNNFRLICVGNSSSEIYEEDIDYLSTILHESGVLKILTNLQLYGNSSKTSYWEVLDIELLRLWSSAGEGSNIQWIVRDDDNFSSSFSLSINCECQSGDNGAMINSRQYDGIRTRRIAPPMKLEECIDCFYASTTAKDISVIMALSSNMSTAARRENQCLEVSQWKSSYGGVFLELGFPTSCVCRIGVVDVDAKRHKSLDEYFRLDQNVLAAWKRAHEGVRDFSSSLPCV